VSRTRNIYQIELAYVGPTGSNPATGSHFTNQTQFLYGGTGALNSASGSNLIAELYRVQRVGWNAAKNLTDVNQFGELAAIDRVPLNPPTVSLSIDYLTANLINEKLMGFYVADDNNIEASAVSGIIAGTFNPKNYFLKVVSEGADAIDNPSTSYNVISVGNGFMSSYTAQGAVGGFPTASVTIDALNIQGDAIALHPPGVPIPAINPTDGTRITGWWYKLPTGLTSSRNAPLTANAGISALRPGDITLNLGIGEGDTFYSASDLKIQSYNLSFNLNQEDLNKLGSKYAFAKVPQFPVVASLQVEALVGDLQTGHLGDIVADNRSFNPSVTITKPGDPNTIIVKYILKNAKLDTQASDLSIGANRNLSLTFNSQIGGPENVTAGLFFSGVTVVL
jgi:hypothetical protein